MKRRHRPKNKEIIAKTYNPTPFVFRYMLIVCCFMLIALNTLLFTLPLDARVAGNCSNCHTMHNSQGGQPVARGDAPWGDTGGSTDVRPSLLIASCLGCHSLTTAGESTKAIGGSIIPIVFNITEPTYGAKGLAAGNFFFVSTTVDNTGHNIFPTNTDETLNNTPPGGNFPSGELIQG